MNRANQITLNLERAWRDVLPAKLIAVTKYSTAEEVSFAYHAGQFDFGENRVMDLQEKAHYFAQSGFDKASWHFIGHLQSNKVKELLRVEKLAAIHSVDSLKLTEELIKRKAECRANEVKLFFQINTSREDEKAGFVEHEELFHSIDLVLANEAQSPFRVYGLMTMATIRTENVEQEAHRCFGELLELKKLLEKKYSRVFQLSMGMSQDYKIAQQYQTDFVRIGSQIFKAD